MLLNSIVANCWDQKLILTVPKVKAFFQLTPRKMEETLKSNELQDNDVEAAALLLAERELESEDDDAIDFNT